MSRSKTSRCNRLVITVLFAAVTSLAAPRQMERLGRGVIAVNQGKGKVIGDASKYYVNNNGMILEGPEYLTVFDGPTGAALATTDYMPPRGRDGSGRGDNHGNRVDRFLACVAGLDGVRPSVVELSSAVIVTLCFS